LMKVLLCYSDMSMFFLNLSLSNDEMYTSHFVKGSAIIDPSGTHFILYSPRRSPGRNPARSPRRRFSAGSLVLTILFCSPRLSISRYFDPQRQAPVSSSHSSNSHIPVLCPVMSCSATTMFLAASR
jgi:hypothetical protein